MRQNWGERRDDQPLTRSEVSIEVTGSQPPARTIIIRLAEPSADEFGERRAFRPGGLDHAVYGYGEGGVGQRLGGVGGGHRRSRSGGSRDRGWGGGLIGWSNWRPVGPSTIDYDKAGAGEGILVITLLASKQMSPIKLREHRSLR